MYCPNCKSEIPEGSKFCNECGLSIGAAEKIAQEIYSTIPSPTESNPAPEPLQLQPIITFCCPDCMSQFTICKNLNNTEEKLNSYTVAPEEMPDFSASQDYPDMYAPMENYAYPPQPESVYEPAHPENVDNSFYQPEPMPDDSEITSYGSMGEEYTGGEEDFEFRSSSIRGKTITNGKEYYATVKSRLIGGIIDSLVFVGVTYMLYSMMIAETLQAAVTDIAYKGQTYFSLLFAYWPKLLAIFFFVFLFNTIYSVIIPYILKGQTLGKLVAKTAIINAADESSPSIGTLLVRELIGKPLSILMVFLGMISILTDKEKHLGFHDKMAKTVVIAK